MKKYKKYLISGLTALGIATIGIVLMNLFKINDKAMFFIGWVSHMGYTFTMEEINKRDHENH